MRIVGGRHRGLKLAELGRGDNRAHLRPTPDRVRESLFSILASRGWLDGAQVLDLFAGTGALGLEALSRGAARATFVESGRVGLRLIADNLARAGRTGDATVIARDARKLGPGTPHDLVFLDPPYGQNLGASVLAACLKNGWIAPDALIVWEENARQDPPAGFAPDDHRQYGDTHVTVLTVA